MRRFLLDPPPVGAGVGVDPRDYNDVTPLMTAAERGCCASVDLLIDAWANVVQRNRGDITPLIVAAKYGHAQVGRAFCYLMRMCACMYTYIHMGKCSST
jgi:ankyrin repeat protein